MQSNFLVAMRESKLKKTKIAHVRTHDKCTEIYYCISASQRGYVSVKIRILNFDLFTE